MVLFAVENEYLTFLSCWIEVAAVTQLVTFTSQQRICRADYHWLLCVSETTFFSQVRLLT